jgi:hypothetical protein
MFHELMWLGVVLAIVGLLVVAALAFRASYRQQRADAMLEKGSVDGQRVWKRVLAAEAESSIGASTQPRMV